MHASRTPGGHSPEHGSDRTRTLIVVAIASALVLTTIVASRPGPMPTSRTSTVEEHGLEWGELTIIHTDEAASDGEAGVVEASVLLHGTEFPTADDATDQFVMFQLGDGRFDSDRFSDDSAAERVVGLDDEDVLRFAPGPRPGVPSEAMPPAGRYTMSLDGHIRYAGVAPGRMPLRAYVVDRGGGWDGEVALREVRVR